MRVSSSIKLTKRAMILASTQSVRRCEGGVTEDIGGDGTTTLPLSSIGHLPPQLQSIVQRESLRWASTSSLRATP